LALKICLVIALVGRFLVQLGIMSTPFRWTDLPPGFLALSPMAGVTDSPFRRLCKRYGADVIFTEMVSVEALLHRHPKTTGQMLYYAPEERPIICQLMGSDPARMAEAARVAADLGFDGIDINMGCPAQKVISNDCGSSLLDNPDTAAAIVAAMVQATVLPVSVKMRTGVRDKVQPAFARRMEEAGAAALTIHPRTKEQAYRGQADWQVTAEVAAAVRVPVMGSGDLMTWGDIERLFATTGVQGAFVARGCMGNPWIYLRRPYTPPVDELIAVIRDHTAMMLEHKGPHGLIELRKHLGWYLKGFSGARDLRERCHSVQTVDDIEALLSIVAEVYDLGGVAA
jgi:nifR3 family TIM-barrel protein